ncbi:MAG: hypothetical protein WCI36_01670 [bacterium]
MKINKKIISAYFAIFLVLSFFISLQKVSASYLATPNYSCEGFDLLFEDMCYANASLTGGIVFDKKIYVKADGSLTSEDIGTAGFCEYFNGEVCQIYATAYAATLSFVNSVPIYSLSDNSLSSLSTQQCINPDVNGVCESYFTPILFGYVASTPRFAFYGISLLHDGRVAFSNAFLSADECVNPDINGVCESYFTPTHFGNAADHPWILDQTYVCPPDRTLYTAYCIYSPIITYTCLGNDYPSGNLCLPSGPPAAPSGLYVF